MNNMDSLPEWDGEMLGRIVGHRPELMQRFYDKFLQLSHECIQQIFSHYEQSNWREVSATAHRLKSAARSVGAMKLGGYCEQLELTAPQGESALLLPMLHQIAALAASVQGRLQARPVTSSGNTA